MPLPAHFHPLPLPRGWPRRVRSAVVHLISLARTSLALTRGWASESMSPELRHQAEEDRLQQEVQLLREDLVSYVAHTEKVGCRYGARCHHESFSIHAEYPPDEPRFRFLPTSHRGLMPKRRPHGFDRIHHAARMARVGNTRACAETHVRALAGPEPHRSTILWCLSPPLSCSSCLFRRGRATTRSFSSENHIWSRDSFRAIHPLR